VRERIIDGVNVDQLFSTQSKTTEVIRPRARLAASEKSRESTGHVKGSFNGKPSYRCS
jgi:hypothetical protein